MLQMRIKERGKRGIKIENFHQPLLIDRRKPPPLTIPVNPYGCTSIHVNPTSSRPIPLQTQWSSLLYSGSSYCISKLRGLRHKCVLIRKTRGHQNKKVERVKSVLHSYVEMGEGVHSPPINIPWLSEKKQLKNIWNVSTPWLKYSCRDGALLPSTSYTETG